jgi:hypothetical protein
VGRAVAVDAAGAAYVVGTSFGSDLPVTPDAFQALPQVGTEGFLIRVLTAAPAAPRDLNAIPLSTTQTHLTWQDRSDNETGFEIQRKTVGFATIGAASRNATSFIDDSPPPEPATYRVRAVNRESESPFTNEAVAAPGPPTPPGNLQAFALTSGIVGVTWTDSQGEAGYRVHRRIGNSATSVLLATLPTNTTSFADGAAVPNNPHTYSVTAFNNLGETAAEATVVVLAAPANLDARAVSASATRIDVSWEDRSGPRETGFQLQRRQQGTSSFTTIAVLDANVTSFLDSGLARGTTYSYRVRALAENSVSSFSNTGSATTGIIPVAPSNVRAAALGPDRVEVAWQDNSRFEAGFRVERQDPDQDFRPVGTVATDATSFTDEGLAPLTRYEYRVFAFNDGGDSPASEVAEVTTGRAAGGRLRFAPVRLAFGVVYSGRAREQQVTVRNASATEDLRVTARVADGPFSVGGPGELLIPPGGRRVLKVRFRPAGRGQARGRLVLESSDPRRLREVVPLTGWGVAVR